MQWYECFDLTLDKPLQTKSTIKFWNFISCTFFPKDTIYRGNHTDFYRTMQKHLKIEPYRTCCIPFDVQDVLFSAGLDSKCALCSTISRSLGQIPKFLMRDMRHRYNEVVILSCLFCHQLPFLSRVGSHDGPRADALYDKSVIWRILT